MNKTVVVHQPDFLPHLAFFHRFLSADCYIALDNVQFVHSNRGWTHRDKIKTPRGAQWITVSVKRASRDAAINTIELSDTDWRADNLNLLRQNYRQAPYFEEIIAELEGLYATQCTLLVDFTLASIRMLMRLMDTPIPIILASTLSPSGSKNELLVDLIRKVEGTHYLSGVGARDYFDPVPYAAADIDVRWQEFRHPVYPQLHGEMVPFLSSVDVLFNCGVEKSRQILREATA